MKLRSPADVLTRWMFGIALAIAGAGHAASADAAGALPMFDFTQAGEVARWQSPHDLAPVRAVAEGMQLAITGNDPYLHGPPANWPAGVPVWLHLRLMSDAGGSCQIFYFTELATEEKSVRIAVPAGGWFETQVPLPPLGRAHRLRIDPPGERGTCVVNRLWFSRRLTFTAPQWLKPELPSPGARAKSIQSGALTLRHGARGPGDFRIEVAGELMAAGYSRPMLGYVQAGEPCWLTLTNARTVALRGERDAIAWRHEFVDADGGRWAWEQRLRPGAVAGVVEVETQLRVDRDRAVFHLPVAELLAGLGSFGTNKAQGLFAGVEYLENEPSSSEADLTGPESRRRVPAAHKVTFPLMTIQAGGRFVGLVWEKQLNVCALFDSPDRLYGTDAHLMGLLVPGANGLNREDGNVLPYDAIHLRANEPLRVRYAIIGGEGESVVPAVQLYLALRGWPAPPEVGMTGQDYFALAAHGWLDSKIRNGARYRHAAWPGFDPQPAADAALWMDWLALRTDDTESRGRLTAASRDALEQVPLGNFNNSGVGHVRHPVQALVFGGVAENATAAADSAHALLNRFSADGLVHYRKPERGPDYGRTHWATDANGLTAQVVAALLEAAAFSGDATLIQSGLERLTALKHYNNSVPRGAQTWEIPLHTPDILASAHLVKAYALGYELSGRTEFLEQARYWAWTGVPFVYLESPTDKPVGLYSTIAVLGATSWKAPVWIGLPVQWCGLVYADALRWLARHAPTGPWKQLADGITASGIQQTYPSKETEYQGLLPDSFSLVTQTRNAPAINPATVQALAVEFWGQTPVYEFRALRTAGLRVFAPGVISGVRESARGGAFTVNGWPVKPYWILVNGVRTVPSVRANGKELNPGKAFRHDAASGRLILEGQGTQSWEISR